MAEKKFRAKKRSSLRWDVRRDYVKRGEVWGRSDRVIGEPTNGFRMLNVGISATRRQRAPRELGKGRLTCVVTSKKHGVVLREDDPPEGRRPVNLTVVKKNIYYA